MPGGKPTATAPAKRHCGDRRVAARNPGEFGGLLIRASARYDLSLTDPDLARMKRMGNPTKIIPDGFPWRIVPPWTNQNLERDVGFSLL